MTYLNVENNTNIPKQNNHLFTTTMKLISAADKTQIISLLHSGLSTHQIASYTGYSTATVSRVASKHCPTISKAVGGCPSKLTASDIQYATHLISSKKADNAVQVTRQLRNMNNQSLSAQTTRRALKNAGLRAVVKQKKPLLTRSIGKLGYSLHWLTKTGL